MDFIVVVAHQKGGVGKSTIASNLAVEFSKTHKVSVIDLDIQKSISYFNSVRTENKLNVENINNFEQLKSLINNNQNILIIDVGGFDSDLNRAAILGADVVITPVSDSAIEVVGLLSFKEILKSISEVRQDLKVLILLNRIHVSAKTSINKLKEFINTNPEFTLMNSILRDRIEYKKAFELGLSVNELNSNSKAANEIDNLMKEMNNG